MQIKQIGLISCKVTILREKEFIGNIEVNLSNTLNRYEKIIPKIKKIH